MGGVDFPTQAIVSVQQVTANQNGSVELSAILFMSPRKNLRFTLLSQSDNQLALQLPESNPMTLYLHHMQHGEDRSPVYTWAPVIAQSV